MRCASMGCSNEMWIQDDSPGPRWRPARGGPDLERSSLRLHKTSKERVSLLQNMRASLNGLEVVSRDRKDTFAECGLLHCGALLGKIGYAQINSSAKQQGIRLFCLCGCAWTADMERSTQGVDKCCPERAIHRAYMLDHEAIVTALCENPNYPDIAPLSSELKDMLHLCQTLHAGAHGVLVPSDMLSVVQRPHRLAEICEEHAACQDSG